MLRKFDPFTISYRKFARNLIIYFSIFFNMKKKNLFILNFETIFSKNIRF